MAALCCAVVSLPAAFARVGVLTAGEATPGFPGLRTLGVAPTASYVNGPGDADAVVRFEVASFCALPVAEVSRAPGDCACADTPTPIAATSASGMIDSAIRPLRVG